MDTDQLNRWLALGANTGVLIGLILVIVQMNQNEDLMRVQIMNQYYESYIDADAVASGENIPEVFEKSMIEPENLSFAEMRALDSQTFGPLLRWVNLYRLSESGILDASEWQSQVILDAGFYFGTPYGRAWWEYQSREKDMLAGLVPTELRDFINLQLETNSPDNVLSEYREIQQLIRERAVSGQVEN